jgi:cell division protein FtsL
MSPPLRPPSKRSVAALLMIVAAALAALGALRVRSQHELLRLGYELTEATAELREKREENRRLRLELSVLTAPDRIERLAEGMGLTPPEPGQIREATSGAEGAPR